MWAARTRKQRQRNRITVTKSVLNAEMKRGSHGSTVRMGLWKVASVGLFFIDLVWPTVTRTLLQFNTCRDLGESGFWLEADFSIRCSGDKYEAYMPWVIVAAVFYSCGVPILFMHLVRQFADRGKEGDKVVRLAMGWMCTSKCSTCYYLFAGFLILLF